MTQRIKHSGYTDWECHKCKGINTSRQSKLQIFSTGRSRIQCKHCKGIFQMIKGEIIGEGSSVGDSDLARVENIDVSGSAEFTDPGEG